MSGALLSLVVAYGITADPPQSKLPSIEVNAITEGVEIFVGKMRMVGTRFKLDQDGRRLILEGTPALLQLNFAGEPRKGVRGKRLIVNLGDNSVSIDETPPANAAVPPKKD